MAQKKTSIFTLTERMTLDTANVAVSATIDLGSYVDVADRQAIQVHSVDYIFQGVTGATSLRATFNGDTTTLVQLTDLNRGGFVFADDRSLISSAALHYGSGDNILTNDADMFPDNYGKGADDGRFVVNDTLYLIASTGSMNADQAVNVTVRVNCSVVSLSAKDFMAIAIQSTAADN